MEASLGMNILRSILAAITYSVFELIEWVMHGIFDIAALQTNQGLIGDIYMRIYVLLGIFMAFKLIVSFLKYLANPDLMMDKEKGAGKLITRVVTMLVLLILLPMLFPLLNRVQTEFLPVLPRVILGQNTDNSNTVSSNAKVLSTAMLSAFYTPSTAIRESDRPDPITDIDDLMDTYLDKTNGYYAYDFSWAAPIAGVVVVLILLSMTIKIGIRIFKLLILEMVAPIPVMSYIDPKSSKDGAFASWAKQLTSTFLDIFVRLGVIYVVLMILSAWATDPFKLSGLFNPNSVPTDPMRLTYLHVFLMIALLMFAKDAPNFVKEALGIKPDKDTSGFLSAITGAITGGATGVVSGAISGRGLRGAITGGATGISAGWQGGATGKKANVWSAAGDAALQARTGNPKAKSGILAAMQASATKAQLNKQGRKLNITNDSIEQAKQNMLDMQSEATRAKDNLDYGMKTGIYRDLNGNILVDDANSTAYEKARDIKDTMETASTIATKNYEKMNKAGDTYMVNRNFAEDLAYERKKSKRAGDPRATYKAKGEANPNKGRIERNP